MKPLFILLFSSLAFIPSVIALSPFPEKDAIWCVRTKFGYHEQGEYIYGLIGDTLIEGKQYSKLYQLNDTTLNIDEGDRYIGALRNEGEKVWIYPEYVYPKEEKHDYLVYDFNLDVGDTVVHDMRIWNDGEFLFEYFPGWIKEVVLSKTTDELGRIKYLFRDEERGDVGLQSPEEWIEGIGSLRGILWSICTMPMSHGGNTTTDLLCMKQGDSIIYHNTALCERCFGYHGVSIEDTRTDEQVATLYPNPVREYLTIDLAEPAASVQFTLYDTQGQEQYTRQLTEPHTRLALPARLKGLYHYRLTGGDNYRQSGTLLIE